MGALLESSGGRAAWVLRLQQTVVVCALLLMGGPAPAAQTGGNPALTEAERAFNAGKYDDVDRLLRDASSPDLIALRARAEMARGRYAEAEKLLAAPAAAAPTSAAALELGLLQAHLGRRQDATRTLGRLLSTLNAGTPAEYLRLSRAARALRQFEEANSYVRAANRLDPEDAEINTVWGELFLEKYNRDDALKSFQDALTAQETYVPALVGLARVMMSENPPSAQESVARALAVNPSYVPAHLLAAEMALDDRQRDAGKAAIQKALAVNANSLEARSLDAAVAFLEGRSADFDRKVQEVLKINPTYGEIYRVAGDQAARNYRFDEAADLVRKALAIDPDHTEAYADLGMHLLRTGDEAGARQALERAFKDDPYNVVTYNLLSMLDTVDKFETIKDGDLVVRLAPEEAGVMREQVVPVAKEALAALSKRWDFKPTGPILIEMFPKHDDFAVRNVGLPGMIGALGACFGRVVTLDAPHARPPGEYSWQPTLWHELAHVITLQMSNNRVPRWLTEGISVWEERRARPEWGREMEVTFAHALEQKRVLKLEVLNEGFSDPKMISLAYYQASLLVEHLAETYGEPSLRTLLRAYGRGLETDAALREAFGGATIADIQKTFDARLARDYANLRAALKRPEIRPEPTLEDLKKLGADNPGSFPVQMLLGEALKAARDNAGALAAFERAAQLVPSATGDDNPNKAIAEIALEMGNRARAARALEAVVKVDHSDVESARKLAELLEPEGDADRLEKAYQTITAIDPFEAPAQAALGRLALQRKDAPTALRALRSLLATNPPDRAAAHTDIAEAYLLAGDVNEAKRNTLAAMEIAPSYERAQELLLKIAELAPARP